jgi:hypothetical protein
LGYKEEERKEKREEEWQGGIKKAAWRGDVRRVF